MKNRGQFFLIATFIVISLFLSLTFTYNYVATSSRSSDIDSITNNLKFEGVNIINNGYKYDLAYENIGDNLRNFTNLTSFSFKSYNFTIIEVCSGCTAKAYNYMAGREADVSSRISMPFDRSNITLDLNSLKFNFNLSKGYNFFVIVINEGQNEKYISSA